MKTQTIRLLDVFFIGPLMAWGGLKLRDEYPLAGATLAVLGATTVLYNGNNYLKVQRLGLDA